MRFLSRAIGALLPFIVLYPVAAAELTHHDIEAGFDPVERELTVTDRITARGETVTLRIAPWLSIERADAGGARIAPLRFGNIWKIQRPAGDDGPLTLFLRGIVPALPDGAARRRAHGAVAGPAGTYLPGHTGWIADTGEDWITYTLRLSVGGGQTGVATGRLTDERRDGVRYSATFVADYPSEPPSVFLGPYEIAEQNVGGVRVRTYFHDDIATWAEHYIRASAGFITDFEKRIGPYPFADFHIVASPLPVGLGFPNLTYIGRMIVPLPFMRGRSLAHEVLHNWWGNGVAIDYARGNWAEGLTTYMADYALAEEQGPDAAREMRLRWLRDFAALPTARDMPVTAFTAKTHQAAQVIGYNKVAYVFHMLKRELGAETFSAGLRRFWRDRKFTVAAWRDLQAAFELASGRDLDWFFDQWLMRLGAPRVTLEDARDEPGESLSITLRQASPAFALTVPIAIETEDTTHRRHVRFDRTEQRFVLRIPGRPRRVSVDPDFEIFRQLLPGESPPILRDVTLAQKATPIVLPSDPAFAAAAHALARRLLDPHAEIAPGGRGSPPDGPAIVFGDAAQIAAYLRSAALQPPPKEVRGGTAAAWVARGDPPLLLVRAATVDALRALMRPLPHYGNRSYIVFEGSRAIRKGVWRMGSSPLSVDISR